MAGVMGENSIPKIVFLGTFPPTEEGIATFNKDLFTSMQKLLGNHARCEVLAVNLADTSPYYFDERVHWEIDQETVETYESTAKEINEDPNIKCVIIQHEYGIFGGMWGEYILQFMKSIDKPIVTIMHSVLKTHPHKPKKFREVTDRVVEYSNALILLSKKSKETLLKLYPDAKNKIKYIPHGIHAVCFSYPNKTKKDLNLDDRTVLTTFGLLSRDKGIEYVIEALPAVVEKNPDVLYLVLGQTHPIIRQHDGEEYRTELVRKVRTLNLKKHVRFVDKYLALDEILTYLKGTDIYISTSVNKDQAVSGTFSYGVGVGRAVVSTSFVQSNEVVTRSMGRLVPARDPKAYVRAINELLENRSKLNKLHKKSYSSTRNMLWTNVAKQYIEAIEEITGSSKKKLNLPTIDFSYLRKLTKKHGIIQFAKYDIPAHESGYTLDDNARALIATGWALENGYSEKFIQPLLLKYFRFLKISQDKSGNFTNYYDVNLEKTSQNKDENPEEHFGRAMWALAETIVNKKTSTKTKNQGKKLWKKSYDNMDTLSHLRPKAFLIKAACILHQTNKDEDLKVLINEFATFLVSRYHEEKRKNWHWFEDKLAYNNAILPESLALAYKATGNEEYLKIAKKTFSFLINKTFMGEVYVPIGQKNWYKRGKKRSYYDQQPEATASSVLALLSMYEVTNQEKYLHRAKNAFSWFLGNNLNGIPLCNFRTGGIYDGLHEQGVNKNQGAESLLGYLLARIKINNYY
jgi:glycosyltransferase involved in cell wall biosynthesis